MQRSCSRSCCFRSFFPRNCFPIKIKMKILEANIYSKAFFNCWLVCAYIRELYVDLRLSQIRIFHAALLCIFPPRNGMARRRPPTKTRCYVSTFCRFNSLFAHVNLLAFMPVLRNVSRDASRSVILPDFRFLSSFLMCKPLAFTVALMYVVLWLFMCAHIHGFEKGDPRQTLAFCLGIFVSLLIWPSITLQRNFYLHFFEFLLAPRRGGSKKEEKKASSAWQTFRRETLYFAA